jgi:hypothetical protein
VLDVIIANTIPALPIIKTLIFRPFYHLRRTGGETVFRPYGSSFREKPLDSAGFCLEKDSVGLALSSFQDQIGRQRIGKERLRYVLSVSSLGLMSVSETKLRDLYCGFPSLDVFRSW